MKISRKLLFALSVVMLVFIMVTVFRLSAQPREQSNNLSRGVTAFLVDWLPWTAQHSPEQKLRDITELNNHIRKLAHFTIYAAMGFFAASSLTFSRRVKNGRIIAVLTVALCCLYAVSDELHQGFVEGRGPLVKDVFIDTAGAAAGAAVLGLLYFALKRHDRLPQD